MLVPGRVFLFAPFKRPAFHASLYKFPRYQTPFFVLKIIFGIPRIVDLLPKNRPASGNTEETNMYRSPKIYLKQSVNSHLADAIFVPNSGVSPSSSGQGVLWHVHDLGKPK